MSLTNTSRPARLNSLRSAAAWLLDPSSNCSAGRGLQALLGLFADLGSQVIVTLSTFLLTPLILALTSKSLYGSWQAALAILSYLAMLDAGLGFSLVRLVAAATDKRSGKGVSPVASAAFFSFAVMGGIVLVGGLVAAPHIPFWFHVPSQEAAAVVHAYRLAALAGAVGLPVGTFNGILVGMQRTALAGLLRGAGALAGAITAVILLQMHMGIAALALSNLTTSLFGGLFALVLIRRLEPGFRIRIQSVTRLELAALWAVAGYFQLVRIAYIVALNTDPLIIAAFAGASQVTPYVITLRMATMFSVVLADKAPSAVYPAFAQMYAQGELPRLREAFLALVFYSTRLAMIGATVVALLNPAFVACWVGTQAYGGLTLNCVFVYWVLFDTILRGSSLIPLVTGDMKVWALTSVAEALVNVGFSVVLIRPFGMVGVAMGTAIARTCLTGAIMPLWSCRKLNLRFSSLLLGGILKPICQSLPAVCVTGLAAFLIPAGLGWFRLAAVGSIAVLANLAAFEGPKWIRKPTWSLREILTQVLRPDLSAVPAALSE